MDLDSNLPQQEYIPRFAFLLYEPLIGSGQTKTLVSLANAICNDTFLTHIPLVFPVQTIALAATLMAAAKYKHPLPSVQESFNYDQLFKLHQRRCPGVERADFDLKHWAQKVDERICEADVAEVIKTMNDLYTQMDAGGSLFNFTHSL